MLKKSKVIALLVICVMMFASVEPALAWWGEDTAYGTAVGGATGGFWGAVIGAVAAGAAVIATGGLAAIPLAGAAIGGAALTGATYGAVSGAATGAVVGAVSDKETVNKTAMITSGVAAVATVGVGALPFVGAAATGTATVGAGYEAVKEAVKSTASSVVDEAKKHPYITSAAAIKASKELYDGAQLLSAFMKIGSDDNLKNGDKLNNKLEKLEKEGKKVVLKKIEQPTSKSLTAYYTVDGVEHVETFNNK